MTPIVQPAFPVPPFFVDSALITGIFGVCMSDNENSLNPAHPGVATLATPGSQPAGARPFSSPGPHRHIGEAQARRLIDGNSAHGGEANRFRPRHGASV